MSATALQRLKDQLRHGEVDPVTVAEESLSRTNGNQSRNTYLWHDVAWSRAQAEGLPSRFPTPEERPPLYGLPVSLKDCFDLAGTVTSCGVRFYAQHNLPAAQHSAVAARLIECGVVITGKTHLHPLAYGITGENPDFGDCLQPGHPDRLTGGSSSGAAASILEGSAAAAIGTDTGGSIRVPAALCGLAGYRASFALGENLWRGGAHLAKSFDTIGWLYRDLEDGPWLASALFGIPEAHTSWGHPSIAVVGGELLSDCESPVRSGYEATRRELSGADAILTEIEVPFWQETMEIFAPIQAHEAAALHAGHFAEFEPAIRERLTWGASIPEKEIAQLRERRTAFCAEMEKIFSQYDLLILPATPVAKLDAGADHSQTRARLLRYTTPISLAGLPAVVLPASSGVEAGGVQMASAGGHDAELLAWSAKIGRIRRQSG